MKREREKEKVIEKERESEALMGGDKKDIENEKMKKKDKNGEEKKI